jgi:hypothetical protein
MSSLYQFPVSKPVHAMKVTSPDFQVDLLENNLYINFDEVRSTDAIDGIKTTLGIIKNELTVTNDYEVILISGHRGCGKTNLNDTFPYLFLLKKNSSYPPFRRSIFTFCC